jgi:hypothetical protein
MGEAARQSGTGEIRMKERPIIFSGPMVRAILEGRKTQTRRVVTDKHLRRLGLERHGEFIHTTEGQQWDGTFEGEFWNPFGPPGDRLWVRETWAHRRWMLGDASPNPTTIYRADGDDLNGCSYWRSPIHMPRWASRITLEIVSVRVERLRDISESDAKAEGAGPYRCPMAESLVNAVGGGMNPIPYTSGFANLWNSINGPESWAANPWVWVIEFRRVET